ncbi:MAG: NAD-dependent deacetylase [Chloroflexi bacterium]|nr:MAG: NAD-dependent deacetylase [Chloroflexota bacterium]
MAPDHAPTPDLPLTAIDLVERAADLLLQSQYAIALTGAGISAESGIPTFRGKDGLWTKHGEPPLNQFEQFASDPTQWWQDLRRRRENPDELTRAITAAAPNDGHFAVAELERVGVLKHVITQNVDGLHRAAGTQAITEIHGNRGYLRCLDCDSRHPFDELPEALPPRCDACGGLVKTDTVMFGEAIPRDALRACREESERADCMLLVGTTAVVSPAADFAWQIRSRSFPLIEVNLDPTVISSHCQVAIHAPAGEVMSRLLDRVKRGLRTDD